MFPEKLRQTRVLSRAEGDVHNFYHMSRKISNPFNAEDEKTFILVLFRRHCTSLEQVVGLIADDSARLFGGDYCSECNFGETTSPTQKMSTEAADEIVKSLRNSKDLADIGKTNPFTAGTAKFNFDSDIKVGEWLEIKLCYSSFCFLYGIPGNAFKKISAKMKGENTADLKPARPSKPYDHHSYDELFS